MGSAWLLVSCVMLSVLVTTALVSGLLSFYTVALPATVTQELARSGALSLTVSDETGGSPAAAIRLISTTMREAMGPVPYRQYQAVWSEDLVLPGPHAGRNVPALQAASMSDISTFADLTSGTWPTAPQAGQPVGVALPEEVAADLRLSPGSVLDLHYARASTAVRLRVTGLFRPRSQASSYWRLDQIGPAGVTVGSGFAAYGPAVVSPLAFARGPDAAESTTAASTTAGTLLPSQASFEVMPSAAAIRPADLRPLAARLDAAVSNLTFSVSSVSTGMPRVLTDAAEGLTAARSLVLISGLQLLLLATAVLALAGRLLARQREDETALLSARGASWWQLIRPGLWESALGCAVAAGVGAVVGVRLSGLLLGSLIGHRLPAPPLGVAIWIATALLLVFCLGIAIWPALRPAGIAAVRIRRGRQAATATAALAGLDIALIALATVAVHELLTYSAAGKGAHVNPVIVAAPALALAGLALVPLRLLPFAAKGLEKVTARSRWLGSAMVNWEISRRPVRQSGPALLVILAVGMSTLTLAQYQSWRQSAHDQAEFIAGAPVRVSLASALPMTEVHQITRLPGVTAAMPVISEPYGRGELLAVGGPQAAATVTMRPDLSPALAESLLWRALDAGRTPGLALPGRPVRMELAASMAGGLADQLGPVSATVTVQDAYGLAYIFPAGTMPADGRSHELVARLAASAGAAYPLRLLGVSFTFHIPPAATSARAMTADAKAVLTIRAVAVSGSLRGPFGAPCATGSALASWRPRTISAGLGALGAQLNGLTQPAVMNWAVAGQDAKLTLKPGMGPKGSRARLQAQVQVTIPPPRRGVWMIATDGYFRSTGQASGAITSLNVGGTAILGHLSMTVTQFPSVTSGDAIVADAGLLEDAVVSAGGSPLPATSWWLRTAEGAPPRTLPPGSNVVVASVLASSIAHDPLSAAPVKATLAVAAAVAVLAALGFCVSVAASARARRGQRALLAALGVTAGAQARLFCLEEILISGPAAAVGLALGIGLAHLLIPAVTLTATAGLPVPRVLVRLPLSWVILIAIAVPAAPTAAAVVLTFREPDPAAELRAAEAAG